MNKLRNLILGLLIVVILTSPVLVAAQASGAEITQAILDDYANAVTSTVNARKAANGNLNDPAYVASYNQLMDKCKNIGQIIEAITNKKYSSAFEEQTLGCSAGIVNSLIQPTSKFAKYAGRNFTVQADGNNVVQSQMLAISAGTQTVFNKKMYDEIQKQEISSTASAAWSGVSQFINFFIEGIGHITVSLLSGLATICLTVLMYTIDYTQNTDAPNIVDRGWTIIRDFMNIFFIIALILMALGTILRYQPYSVENSKGLLFNLIIMALLINFSKIIAETLIDFSDMLVNLFSPRESVLGYAQLISSSYVTGGDGFSGWFGYGRGVTQGIGNIVSAVIGLTVISIAYAAIAGLMFVRLIGLWFLIMVSPAAFGLNVIPATKDRAKQWWSTFIKYLVWGPVAMFFFKIGFVFMKEKGNNAFSDGMFDNLFVSAFVFAGFLLAKSFGMYGSSAVTSYAEKYGKSARDFAINYGIVRGGAQSHIAGAAGYLASKARPDKFGEDAGARWAKSTKEFWGRGTARVENAPGIIKKALVDNPNAERKSLVESQQRRDLIKYGFMGDYDEEFAKKMKPEDVMYAMDQSSFNEAKINNIMDHGSRQAKWAMLLALREGKLQERMKAAKLTPEVQAEVREKIRKFAWKDSGNKESALSNPKNQKFMSDELAVDDEGKPISVPVLDAQGKQVIIKDVPQTRQITYLERDVILQPKDKSKWKETASIPEKIKGSYQKINKKSYVNKESDTKNDGKDKPSGPTVVGSTDFERDSSEGSAEERRKRRQDAAK